jgi:DNA-binding MarR family transcriptional regulator
MASFFDVELQNKNIDAKISAGLERLSNAFRVMLWEQAKRQSISPIQIQILIFLKYHTQNLLTVSYLAKEMNVTKPTISDAIKVLEQKQYVKKILDSIDARSYSVALTPSGRKITEKTELFAQPLEQLISGISKSNKELIWETLSSLIYQLNKLEIISVQRTCFNCQYYKKSTSNYCTLLNMALAPADIRLDCPEFVEG